MLTKLFNTKNFYHKLTISSFIIIFAGLGSIYLIASNADTPTVNAGQAQAAPTCSMAPVGYATCASLVRTDPSAINLKPTKNFSTNNATASTSTTIGNGGAYDPQEIQAAYNLTSNSSSGGKGETVAIVDAFDDPTAETDLDYYRSFWGLPTCTTANGCFHKVNQEGLPEDYPSVNSDWDGEISLDLDMVSAICPNCQIVLVEANSNMQSDLSAAENTAYQYGPVAISNSYSGDEGLPGSPFYTSAESSSYDHPGTAITVATGDAGYNTGGFDQPTGYGVAYPAVLPYVTAVGGTSLYQNATATTRMATETAWSGAGSGCSTTQAKPSWQTDTGCTNRTISDVSAVADVNTPVWVYESGEWWFYGGTSVATPIIASTYALGSTPYTYSTSIPYANKADFNDITSGTNSTDGCAITYLCTAVVGYDGPTGLGTPNGISGFQPTNLGDVPSVSITSPTEGTNEDSGIFTISGTASDSSSTISSVAISIDGGTYQTISGTNNWSTTLNPASYSIGLHNITIQATNSVGKTSIASEGLLLGNIAPPNPPTQLVDTINGHREIDLRWTASAAGGSPVTSYQISEGKLLLATVTGTSDSITGLDPNQDYMYCVNSVNSIGLESDAICTPEIFLPPIPGNPPTASKLSLLQVTPTQLSISWTPSVSTIGISLYYVYRDGQFDGASEGNYESYADTTIAPGTTYTYYVQAQDLNGTLSPVSNTITVVVPSNTGPPPAITPPSDLTIVVPSYKQVNLTWKDASGGVDGIERYIVYRGGVAVGNVTPPTTGSTVSYSDGTVKQLTKYSYYVIAYDYESNPSKPTSTVTIKTPAEYKVSDLKGTVSNSSTKKAISGVAITDTASNKQIFKATTNSAGEYSLSSLPSGTNTLVLKKPGYTTKTITVTLGAVATKTDNIALVKS